MKRFRFKKGFNSHHYPLVAPIRIVPTLGELEIQKIRDKYGTSKSSGAKFVHTIYEGGREMAEVIIYKT